MFGLTRWNPYEGLFGFQREVDRLMNQLWSDLPTRTAAGWTSPSFQVHAHDDVWRVDVPLPGVDPSHVELEGAGNTLSIRVKNPDNKDASDAVRYEQTLTVPQFLDLDRISASHRHGMLQLTIPLKESVKPRRIQIDTAGEDTKRLSAAA